MPVIISDFSVKNGLSVRNITDFFCLFKKIIYILIIRGLCFLQDKKETNLGTKDMQLLLHVFLLSCFYRVM